jgi:glycosyltransferase involved in cell wall biosynthesis
MTCREPKPVLFVGSFRDAAADGTVGGQWFACRSLLGSPLSAHVRWILLDSTMETLPPPGMVRRAFLAGKRLCAALRILLNHRPKAALIFTSASGPSLLEKTLLAGLLRKAGVRVVLSLRSEVVASDFIRRMVLAHACRSADVVICQSSSAAHALPRHPNAPHARVVVVPNWVDASIYASIPELPLAGEAKRPPVSFLYLGWLEHYKGVMDVLAAFEYLVTLLPDTQLDICGEGRLSLAVRERIENTGLGNRVRLLGWVHGADKTRVLEKATALVLPSHTEGMPNAVLEAMASGRPVIATRVGGVPELVEDGRTGLLVEAGDIGALARAMQWMAEHRSEAGDMGRLGRRRVLERHDVRETWQAVADALDVM